MLYSRSKVMMVTSNATNSEVPFLYFLIHCMVRSNKQNTPIKVRLTGSAHSASWLWVLMSRVLCMPDMTILILYATLLAVSVWCSYSNQKCCLVSTMVGKCLALNDIFCSSHASQSQACPKVSSGKKRREAFDHVGPNKSVEQRA